MCTSQHFIFRNLCYGILWYRHFPLKIFINITLERALWRHELCYYLTHNFNSISNYRYTFSEAYSIPFHRKFYKTSKCTSLLIYPSSPYITIYYYQLLPNFHTIRVAHRCQIFSSKCHINSVPLLKSCVYSRSDSKQGSHRIPKYITTYAILQISLFSTL